MLTDKEEENDISLHKGKSETKISLNDLKKEIEMHLQIENLNILIGAGCSSNIVDGEEKAIPTMDRMAKEFYEKNQEILDVDVKGEKIGDDIAVKTNLETLVSRLISIGNAFESERASMEKIKEAVNKFILEKVTKPPCKELLHVYMEFYTRIEKKMREVPVNVYTTNYDLYNENALDELGVMYNNGFLGSTKRRFNPNSYNYVLVENLNLSKSSWRSVNNFINLYKLHGSINWVKDGDDIIEKECDHSKGGFGSMMIYPTPQKDQSTLMTPYSDLFRVMQNNLMKNNSVLITLGYSFSDDHINRIIFNALSVSDFRLIIFGKSKYIDEIINANSKRVWVINSNSDKKIHYFNNFVEMVLPQRDETQKRRQEEREAIQILSNLINLMGNKP
jgi:hypothetical protein